VSALIEYSFVVCINGTLLFSGVTTSSIHLLFVAVVGAKSGSNAGI
jgi:hypothetical protein